MAAESCGGYDFQFVKSPPDIVMCVICHLPSRDPYLSECCGHIFCRTCLRQCNTRQYTICCCPTCKNICFKTVLNKQIDREVKSLNVYCTNKEMGCKWQGEINDITDHLGKSNGCKYVEVECSLGCRMMIQRWQLTDHVEKSCTHRKVVCEHCAVTGEWSYIEVDHKEKCPKIPLTCPNNCEVGTVPREDMEAHRKECPLEIVHCEYHGVGCEVKVTRKRIKNHEEENMEGHLRMTKLKLAKTEERLSKLENTLSQLIRNSTGTGMVMVETNWSSHLAALSANTLNTTCPVIMKLSKSADHMKIGIRRYSEPFYTCKNGYQMCLSSDVSDDDDHLSIWAHVIKGSHDDELTWPLRGKLEIKLLNQISDNEHYSKMLTYDDRVGDDTSGRVPDNESIGKGWGYSHFISFKNLYKNTETCQFVKNDCMFFQVRSYINI